MLAQGGGWDGGRGRGCNSAENTNCCVCCSNAPPPLYKSFRAQPSSAPSTSLRSECVIIRKALFRQRLPYPGPPPHQDSQRGSCSHSRRSCCKAENGHGDGYGWVGVVVAVVVVVVAEGVGDFYCLMCWDKARSVGLQVQARTTADEESELGTAQHSAGLPSAAQP